MDRPPLLEPAETDFNPTLSLPCASNKSRSANWIRESALASPTFDRHFPPKDEAVLARVREHGRVLPGTADGHGQSRRAPSGHRPGPPRVHHRFPGRPCPGHRGRRIITANFDEAGLIERRALPGLLPPRRQRVSTRKVSSHRSPATTSNGRTDDPAPAAPSPTWTSPSSAPRNRSPCRPPAPGTTGPPPPPSGAGTES